MILASQIRFLALVLLVSRSIPTAYMLQSPVIASHALAQVLAASRVCTTKISCSRSATDEVDVFGVLDIFVPSFGRLVMPIP